MSTSPTEYVVLDVETNGLRSKEHDLLSISIYKPDDGKEYDRFLPLDLNDHIPVDITAINGIRKRQLRGKKHLSQEEVDKLFVEFELDKRTMLHYGNLDERFIKAYFERHGLLGYEMMRFFNFKKLICASKYSDGSLSKDNLCRMFGIEGVTDVHSGINDCRLEWALFKAIGGRHLLAKMTENGYSIETLSPDYIVPVSYLTTFPNLSRAFDRPYLDAESTPIFHQTVEFELPPDAFAMRLILNGTGMVLEHLINVMLAVKKQDNGAYLARNRSQNELLGTFDHATHFIPTCFNPDGTITFQKGTFQKDEHKTTENAFNHFVGTLRNLIQPCIEFIKQDIFGGAQISSQELVVHESLGILALCDLSSEDAVLEVKAYPAKLDDVKEQLFYEANGRKTYLLTIKRGLDWIDINILEAHITPGEKPDGRRIRAIKAISESLEPLSISISNYQGSTKPIMLHCGICGQDWEETYARIKSGSAACPYCHPEKKRRPYTKRDKKPVQMTADERLRQRASKYAKKVCMLSSEQLVVDQSSYTRCKAKVRVTCINCGRSWYPRGDHLLEACYCKHCKQRGGTDT